MKIFSFANKLILFLSFFVLFVLVTVVTYSFIEAEDILKNQISKDLTAIAEGTEGQILIFFEKIKMQSVNWSSDGFIRQQTEELAKTGRQDSVMAVKDYLLKNKMPFDPMVVVVDILDIDMKIIASDGFS